MHLNAAGYDSVLNGHDLLISYLTLLYHTRQPAEQRTAVSLVLQTRDSVVHHINVGNSQYPPASFI